MVRLRSWRTPQLTSIQFEHLPLITTRSTWYAVSFSSTHETIVRDFIKCFLAIKVDFIHCPNIIIHITHVVEEIKQNLLDIYKTLLDIFYDGIIFQESYCFIPNHWLHKLAHNWTEAYGTVILRTKCYLLKNRTTSSNICH